MEVNLDWRDFQSALFPEVHCQIRPLRVAAYQRCITLWSKFSFMDTQGGTKEEVEKAASERSRALFTQYLPDLLEVAKVIFPDHVRHLVGITILKDGARKAGDVTDLWEETAFSSITIEVLSVLMTISSLSVVEAKNSNVRLENDGGVRVS